MSASPDLEFLVSWLYRMPGTFLSHMKRYHVCVCVIQEGILNQSNLRLICQPGNMWWMAWRQEGSRNFDNVIFILRSMQSKYKMFAFIYFTTAVHWLHKNSIIKRMTLALANRIVFSWKKWLCHCVSLECVSLHHSTHVMNMWICDQGQTYIDTVGAQDNPLAL